MSLPMLVKKLFNAKPRTVPTALRTIISVLKVIVFITYNRVRYYLSARKP